MTAHLTKPIRAIRFLVLAFLMTIGSQVSAATNAETIQYIFDKHEAECVAEQYEVLTAVVGGETTAHEVRQRARCHNRV